MLVFAFALAAAQAGSAKEPLISAPGVFGIGAKSCREWNIYKDDKDTRVAEEQWVASYVSGVDLVESLDGVADLIRNSDKFTDLIGVVDDFCQSHPLEGVDAASRDLLRQLMKRRTGER